MPRYSVKYQPSLVQRRPNHAIPMPVERPPIGQRLCSRRGCCNVETVVCEICHFAYCSRVCQMLDWSVAHVFVCKPVPGALSIDDVRKSVFSANPGLPPAIAQAREDHFKGARRDGNRGPAGQEIWPDTASPPLMPASIPSHRPSSRDGLVPSPPQSNSSSSSDPWNPQLPSFTPGKDVWSVPSSRGSTPPASVANVPFKFPVDDQPRLPNTFADLKDLMDLYTNNELVEIVVTNEGPTKGLFWGYLIPVENKVARAAFDEVMKFLPLVNPKWRPIGTAKFGDRIMYREKRFNAVFRGTVVKPSKDAATVFCEDFGFMSIVSKSGEVTDLDHVRRFPGLALGFVDVPPEYAPLFTPDFNSPVGKMRGYVTRGVAEYSGNLYVCFEERPDLYFVARNWADCVSVPVKIEDVPVRPSLVPGTEIEGAVAHYSYPDPLVYCYEACDVGCMADLTDALVMAYARMTAKKLDPWKIGEVGMCEDNYGTVARFVVKEVVDDDTLRVFFFDFGDIDTRPVSKCRPIPIHFAKLPINLITFALDCGGKRLSEKAYEYFASFCDGQETVKLVTHHITADRLPSGDIIPTDKEKPSFVEFLNLHPRRLMWKDDVTYKKPELGSELTIKVMDATFDCHEIYDFAGYLDVAPERVLEQSSLDTLVDKRAGEDSSDAHAPVPGELVLASDEGSFFRAVAVNEFKVWFLDYGNARNVTRSDIRRMPADCATVCPLVHVFRFHDTDKLTEKQRIARGEEILKKGSVKGKLKRWTDNAPIAHVEILGL